MYVSLVFINRFMVGTSSSSVCFFFGTGVENGTVNWVLKFMFSIGIIRCILIIIFCYQEFYCQILVFLKNYNISNSFKI